MIDHNPEKRTPSAWSRNCLVILKRLNRNYRKNKEVKGRFIEFIREDDSGLIISNNFVRIRDTYHLGFALLFTTKPTEVLCHPMLAGSRFDHNRTIWQQFDQDLGLFYKNPKCPRGIWSFGPWRRNTMEQLIRGLPLPEKYLFPHYRDCLQKGKRRLIELFSGANKLLSGCHASSATSPESLADLIGVDPEIVSKYRMEAIVLDAIKIATGGKCWYGFGNPNNCFTVEEVPLEAIILNNSEVFLAEQLRLSKILEVAENL